MLKRNLSVLAAAVLGFALAPALAQALAAGAKPTMPQVCTSCHKPAPNTIQGYFDNVAFKSTSIQLNLGTSVEIVRFDPKTLKVIDAGDEKAPEHLGDVRKGREAKITYVESGGVKTARSIAFKGPIKIAPEKLIPYAEVAKLVALGPEKGRYTLIDSRPLPRFQEGTIPTAINLPFPAFDKFTDRLPQSKSDLLVFFCQGVTCMMSPSSLRRAEAMGYTNVKVYREGWPEWTQKNYGVLSPQFLKEAFLDKGIPHVLLDARPAAEVARTGFIVGAVALPPNQVKAALARFPKKELKAPIMVYDGRGTDEALKVAQTIVAAGYENVTVITGGLVAWQAAGYPLAQGQPATKVAYVPKPRPGSIPIEEFRKLAANTPADTLILDVRNRDEANAGMIKGAMLIPDEELLARMAEVPKDKRIVTHCSTGVRAEMAYHKLKEAGYKVAFLHAAVDIDKTGKFEITPP